MGLKKGFGRKPDKIRARVRPAPSPAPVCGRPECAPNRCGEPQRCPVASLKPSMTRCQPRPAARMNALLQPCCAHLGPSRRSRVLGPESLILRGTWNMFALRRSPSICSNPRLRIPDCSFTLSFADHRTRFEFPSPRTRFASDLRRVYPSRRSVGLMLRPATSDPMAAAVVFRSALHPHSPIFFRLLPVQLPLRVAGLPIVWLCFRSARLKVRSNRQSAVAQGPIPGQPPKRFLGCGLNRRLPPMQRVSVSGNLVLRRPARATETVTRADSSCSV